MNESGDQIQPEVGVCTRCGQTAELDDTTGYIPEGMGHGMVCRDCLLTLSGGTC